MFNTCNLFAFLLFVSFVVVLSIVLEGQILLLMFHLGDFLAIRNCEYHFLLLDLGTPVFVFHVVNWFDTDWTNIRDRVFVLYHYHFPISPSREAYSPSRLLEARACSESSILASCGIDGRTTTAIHLMCMRSTAC